MSGFESSNRDAAPAADPLALTVYELAEPRGGGPSKRVRSGRIKLLLVLLVCALPVIASYFTYLVAFGGMEFSLVFLARERMDYTPPQMTMIFIFIGITLILVQGGFVRRRAAKIGEKKLVLAGCISTLAGFTILAMAHSQGIFYAGLLLMAAGGAMTMPCYSALVSLQSTETEQGRNLGAFRAYGSLARAIGPIAASAIFFLAGSAPTYCIGGVMALAACIVATRIRDPRKQG